MSKPNLSEVLKALKNKKGQAGLQILLSVVAMLFMIGIVIMVFVIAGVKLEDSVTDQEAKDVINNTYQSLDDTVDWFPTIIVLAAIVVIILLVVLIINAVRGSGLLQQGGA